jgi:hypothetical protein
LLKMSGLEVLKHDGPFGSFPMTWTRLGKMNRIKQIDLLA